jgi:DNA ligase-1
MPPKQATLGYVKDSQTTLRCVNLLAHGQQCEALTDGSLFSKFFKNPNGITPKEAPKQSKLAFSTKSNTNGAAPVATTSSAQGDVDMKNDSDSESKPAPQKESLVESKENVKPKKGT